MTAVQATVSKTNEVLAQVLTKALEVAEKTGSFVVEQAPDVVRQLVLYYTVLFWAHVVLGAIVIVSGAILSTRLFKKAAARAAESEYKSMDDFGQFFGGVVALTVTLVAGAGLFFSNIADALKITLAPKVWLIEYAASLIR